MVLLSKPATTTRVLPTSAAALAYPAKGIHVALDIKGIVKLLKGTAGSTPERRSFDFCGKFLGMGASRQAAKAGTSLQVAEAEFTDAGGGKIVVSVWQGARGYFSGVPSGAGVAVLGCSAALEGGEVKINVWPGAHVCTSGEQAQSLTSLETTGESAEVLTATFTPGRGLAALVDAAAHPTCAAALADAVAKSDAITFQINRCILEAPLQQEAMYTQDGRLFLKSCRLRDGTGGGRRRRGHERRPGALRLRKCRGRARAPWRPVSDRREGAAQRSRRSSHREWGNQALHRGGWHRTSQRCCLHGGRALVPWPL